MLIMGLIKIGFGYASLNMNFMMHVRSIREHETKAFSKREIVHPGGRV